MSKRHPNRYVKRGSVWECASCLKETITTPGSAAPVCDVCHPKRSRTRHDAFMTYRGGRFLYAADDVKPIDVEPTTAHDEA